MFDKLLDNLQDEIRLVYPEGEDIRIMSGAARLTNQGKIKGILLGNEEEISKIAKENDINIENLEIIDVAKADKAQMKEKFLEIRKGKVSSEEADELLEIPQYYGTMMVKMGLADGMVAGAVESSGFTMRPAFQIIKAKEGNKRISGAMLMLGPEGEAYVFSDVAINMTSSPEELAELADQSAQTAKLFGLDPKIAFLSFSTMGSAVSDQTKAVREAVEIARDKYPDLCLDGEMQFDAAISPEVAKAKAPDSEVAGKANVFIFPDLQAGNIGYKIAERLGEYEAIGPLLQGIAAPISDLSRGCSAEDVYKVSIITALQAQNDKRAK